MLWEGRALLGVREDDVRGVVESGLQEHLQLEYKSELYADGERGRRELLLDITMFANTIGGILLIGIPEMRDERGQPTGVPDPAAILGVEIANAEAVLGSYDARVMEAVEERLPLESAPIDVGNGRSVLAIRVPNSSKKPHSVRHEGHIYFPARRERQRYHLNVREIKELVIRTASRSQQAKEMLKASFLRVTLLTDQPYLIIGMVPVFFDDFLIDVRRGDIRTAIANFSRTTQFDQRDPAFTFDGLQRSGGAFDHSVTLGRNGLLTASSQLPLLVAQERIGQHVFNLGAIDLLLRNFMQRAAAVYGASGIGGPFVLGMMLRARTALAAAWPGQLPGSTEMSEPIPARDLMFRYLQLDDLPAADAAICPLCDQAYQLFGLQASPNFNTEGVWIARQR